MSKKRFGSKMLFALLAATTLLVQSTPLTHAATEPKKPAVDTKKLEDQFKKQEEAHTEFTDLGNSYARKAVNRLAALHMISGQGENRFNPQNTISRQDIAVLLTKVIGLQPTEIEKAVFEDVPLENPYAPYVYGLSELGVMNGKSEHTMGALDPLTRQELAVMLSRLMKEGSVTKVAGQTPVTYNDGEEIADYAKTAVEEVTNQRWMQGANGKFNPTGTVTRAEAAVIAERVLDARYQQAEQVKYKVDVERLSLAAGTSQRLKVNSIGGDELPFTPIFAFDRPELGTISADGTFVAGPTAGKGNLTVTVGYKTTTIPVEIKNASEPAVEKAEDTPTTAPVTSSNDSATKVDESKKVVEEEAKEPAKKDELVNIAPGSYTAVTTFGTPDSYFQEMEKKYPGPVGGLVTPTGDWTGYYRQFGRKVTVELDEAKPLERVALTFKQQKTSGITMPEYMEVEVSRDGKVWSYAGRAVHDVSPNEDKLVTRTLSVTLPDVNIRYVRASFPVKVFTFARQLEVWAKAESEWNNGAVLLPPPNPAKLEEAKQSGRRVENMLLAYSGEHGEYGTWTKEDFLPMVGYRTVDGYMRDQMFDTILFLPYQTIPATKESWTKYMNDLFGSNKQLDALNQAMREYNRLRGTLYSTPTQENVVLALPYPNASQTNFGQLDEKKPSLSFSPAGIGEEQAYLNRKAAMEWYFQELMKRWNKEGYAYLKLEGIYWFHELVEDSAPKERQLIRDMGSMVHDEALRYYWIPYFGSPGVSEWKSLYFDKAFLQPGYYSDKPVGIDRIQGVLDVVKKYDMDIEIEGDRKMYDDPKFYQTYYNQLVATHKLGMDKNNVHAYYFGSKTLLESVKSTDPVKRAIYDDTYKWMRGRLDRTEFFEGSEMP
ncbi:DUF4855 domain-containing protein [Brevibacillus sp. HB1.3]|uniref:DUF4855 domain-containing protein n=1 Tax=Brevibacillus sp. HB1.3 TaxID=2738842 RepID=UPI0015525472|nr:DUF4855 domain-containing protein [Brevibacillus sp. HB1.3]NQF13424.1 DUF4855 domain-containing protein [Brevibacillus sp. HB1.3]